jgi:predicted AlkP superfamily pyrophosphatase or phosphodiesterase
VRGYIDPPQNAFGLANMFLRLALTFILCASIASPAPQRKLPTWKKAPGVEHVLIISIDGLRPDVFLLADAPNIRALAHAGSYTFFGQTIADAYTLPAHVSMLTGVTSEKHGVTWNDYIEDSYAKVPTLFELAKRKGLSTAMSVAKMKFIALAKPGTIDFAYLADEDKTTDVDVEMEAVKIIIEHKPQVMFVHFGEVDVAGHARGWGSAQQMQKIHKADAHVSNVLAALHRAGVDQSTLIILTSDHGGSGRGHGPDDLPSKVIPWIAVGPGVRKDFDLTLLRGRAVQTMDTFATAAAALGIEVPYPIDGQPVEGIFMPDELLKDAMPAW